MGRQHPLHFFSLRTLHSFQTTLREEGTKPFAKKQAESCGATESFGPSAKRDAEPHREDERPHNCFESPLHLQEVFAMENETQLLCQAQTWPASLGFKSPSERSLRSNSSHPGRKPCCSGAVQCHAESCPSSISVISTAR